MKIKTKLWNDIERIRKVMETQQYFIIGLMGINILFEGLVITILDILIIMTTIIVIRSKTKWEKEEREKCEMKKKNAHIQTEKENQQKKT